MEPRNIKNYLLLFNYSRAYMIETVQDTQYKSSIFRINGCMSNDLNSVIYVKGDNSAEKDPISTE